VKSKERYGSHTCQGGADLEKVQRRVRLHQRQSDMLDSGQGNRPQAGTSPLSFLHLGGQLNPTPPASSAVSTGDVMLSGHPHSALTLLMFHSH
jgi:hypothetical protein